MVLVSLLYGPIVAARMAGVGLKSGSAFRHRQNLEVGERAALFRPMML